MADQTVETVTQQNQETVTKQKNPLRIEQGRKLVEYNRRKKEELKRLNEHITKQDNIAEYKPKPDTNINTHICRIKGCGGAGWPPPPIIFERLKLPQQIIYRRKENLSESPNHQKYWENILVSRFYEQFSRNRRNLGHFRKFKKISNS